MRKVIFFILFFGSIYILKGQKPEEQGILNTFNCQKDVVFKTVNGENVKMLIFYPKQDKIKSQNPWMLYVHGGGWAMGDYQGDDKSNNNQVNLTGQTVNQMSTDNQSSYKIFKGILNNGIAFASIDYRLNSEAKFPAQIFDVKGAIRFLRAHADEYGIDSERIAIAGTSAGAHLATLLATTLISSSSYM